LIARSPASITVMNRTQSRAESLRDDLAEYGLMQVRAINKRGGPRYDLVINGTSTGLQNVGLQLDSALFAESFVAYDMMYAAHDTPFMQWAKAAGARQVLDGLGMLVEQAAESFTLWHGVCPETAGVAAFLRSGL